MNQTHRAATGGFTCQRCGHTVRVRADSGVGVVRCRHCGGQWRVWTGALDRVRTRIDVESREDAVFGPHYGVQ